MTPDPIALSEGDLARLWEGQRFPATALVTREGWPLRVVYRGRRGAGPGPDFRDAVIVGPGGLCQGDVELHVRSSDFRRHGHHLDPAYNGVILHIVFRDDEGEDSRLASGRRAPVVALAPWVARRAAELRHWLSQPARWQEPCASALERRGKALIGAVLDRLGDRRLGKKAAAFARALAGGDGEELLYRGILEALGYSQNRQAFALLARRLPWRHLRPALLAAPEWGRAQAADGLLRQASGLVAGAGPALPWRIRGLRPASHPVRRLGGAARLLARYGERGLVAGLLAAVRDAAAEPAALTAALRVEGIGSARAAEVAVNVVLPFAIAWGKAAGDRPLQLAARGLYRCYPRPSSYGITRHLDRALQASRRDGITIDARRQQGMLYLFGHYCRQGGCGRCPLS